MTNPEPVLRAAFEAALPRKPYVGTRKDRPKIRPRNLALRYDYIQLNHAAHSVGFIVLDVDREGAAFSWEEAGLPQPTYVTISPETGFAHLVYQLACPVNTSETGRKKPQVLLDRIMKGFGVKVGACSVNPITSKNPFSGSWKSIISGRTFELYELADYLPEEPKATAKVISLCGRQKREEYAARGRNCNLFETIRFWAYNRVRLYATAEDFSADVLARIAEENERQDSPLAFNETKNIARSVSRWTWKNQDNFQGTSRRRQHLDPAEIKDRQRKAAAATNNKRRSKTIEAVRGAIEALLSKGIGMDAITQEVLAEAAGVSVRTIARGWKTYQHDMRCCYQGFSRAGSPQDGAERRPSGDQQDREGRPSACGEPGKPGLVLVFQRFFPQLPLTTILRLVDKLCKPGDPPPEIADCPVNVQPEEDPPP